MGSGCHPIDEAIAREIREMVERAFGMEVVNAIREAHRRSIEETAHMTSEEHVRWIIGEGQVEGN